MISRKGFIPARKKGDPRTGQRAGRAVEQPRPSVFIGSSSEALKRGVLAPLVEELSERFEVRPWNMVFEPGRFTLETLLAVSREVDLALFVFADDDERIKRGERNAITRDNVIFEYGLFLSALGRERVLVIQEDGVSLATDFAGLTLGRFKATSDAVMDSDLRTRAREVLRKWSDVPRRPARGSDELDDGGIALAQTVRRAEQRIARTAADLRAYARAGKPVSDKPIRFDSERNCVAAYAEGLDAVVHRFWTTTFLSSGFWNREDATVMEANTRMLDRLDGDGDVRRLFLLNRPPAQEAARRRQRLIHFRQQGAVDEAQRLRRELSSLKRSFAGLSRHNCQVRVGCDSSRMHEGLPRQLDFDPEDTELAIYDGFRVDLFGGGTRGAITNLRIYSPAFKMFAPVLSSTEQYFEGLWEEAEEADVFISRLEEAYESAVKRIDYESNWLVKFEHLLDEGDHRLKVVELSRVEEVLRKAGRTGGVRRYLDIGTCTARYPIALRDFVAPGGQILGIDDDADCVRFSVAKIRDLGGDDRIHIERMDYGAREIRPLEKFDLITCMLSTLSHFGWDRDDGFEDVLQHVLARTAGLLADDGLFIFSVWSEHATAHSRMLSIYQPGDMQRLAEWTPGVTELGRRLAKANLQVEEESQPDLRLHLYVCRRRPDPAADPPVPRP